jgi:exosortase
VLLILLYHRVAVKLVEDWGNLPDFSHGYLIPFFAAFLLYDKRQQLRDTPIVPSWTGLTLIVLGLFELLLGVFGADLFLQRTSFVVVVAGIVWTLLGKAMLSQYPDRGYRQCRQNFWDRVVRAILGSR